MDPVVAAVTERDLDRLAAVLKAGGNPNARDYRGHSVLLIAASSDQFRAANLLVEAGADIWFANEFGMTAGNMADGARVKPDSPEGEAHARFVHTLQAAGFPWPPPPPQEIAKRVAAGAWPPPSAKRAGGS